MLYSSSLHNSPAINRLPDEIFRMIIQYAYTLEPNRHEEDPLCVPLLSPPLQASHVCRSWRYVLLSDPSMWACLEIPKFKACAIEEFIQRSKSGPLSISIMLGYTSIAPPLSVVFQQIHRFKNLQVRIHAGFLDDGFHSFSKKIRCSIQELLTHLQQPAPRLQNFLLWYNDSSFPLQPTFFDTLFSGQAPRLKSIRHELSKELLEIICPLFHNLSELSIHLPFVSSLNADHFLDLLRSSPHLTLLSVHDPWDLARVLSLSGLDSSANRLVDLPHLQQLILKFPYQSDFLDLILEHVTFPSNVKWHIITSSPARPGFNPLSLYPGPERLKATADFLSKTRITSIYILVWDNTASFILTEINDPDSIIYDFDLSTFTYDFKNISQIADRYDPLLESINISSVTRLNIEFSSYNLSNSELIRVRMWYANLKCFLDRKFADSFANLVSFNVLYWNDQMNKHFDFAEVLGDDAVCSEDLVDDSARDATDDSGEDLVLDDLYLKEETNKYFDSTTTEIQADVSSDGDLENDSAGSENTEDSASDSTDDSAEDLTDEFANSESAG